VFDLIRIKVKICRHRSFQMCSCRKVSAVAAIVIAAGTFFGSTNQARVCCQSGAVAIQDGRC